MKILVIGGMHGNEPLGLAIVKFLNKNPIKDVAILIANEKAFKQDSRFIKKDLNRLFPGDNKSEDYETKRAAQILKVCKNFNFVLDFHNTQTSDNDCSFLGKNSNNLLENLSSFLGLKNIIVADYDCINKYAPNCLSIEISLDSKLNNAKIWAEKIKNLQNINLKNISTAKIKKYIFVHRISLEERDKFNLPKEKLMPFNPISNSLANNLKIKTPAFPIFIGSGYTPENYGGIVNLYERN